MQQLSLHGVQPQAIDQLQALLGKGPHQSQTARQKTLVRYEARLMHVEHGISSTLTISARQTAEDHSTVEGRVRQKNDPTFAINAFSGISGPTSKQRFNGRCAAVGIRCHVPCCLRPAAGGSFVRCLEPFDSTVAKSDKFQQQLGFCSKTTWMNPIGSFKIFPRNFSSGTVQCIDTQLSKFC